MADGPPDRRRTGALVGAFLLAAIPYYNIIIPEFNPNVLQLPFWALTGWSFHRAVKENKGCRLARARPLGCGGHANTGSALLLAALAGLMLYHPEARKRLKSIGPWLTIVAAIVLLPRLPAPHVLWLYENDFMPAFHLRLKARLNFCRRGPAFLAVPVFFIFWQGATLLPVALVYGINFGVKWPAKIKRSAVSFDAAFLYTVTFGPAVIACLIAILSGGFVPVNERHARSLPACRARSSIPRLPSPQKTCAASLMRGALFSSPH